MTPKDSLAKAREARKAKSEAHKNARDAAREAAKAAAEADQKKEADEREKLLESLKPKAKEIDERIKLAAKEEDRAWDHRTAAALVLADVKKTCEKHSINFKTWCAENIQEQSYETIRKLASAGEGGKGKAVKAIADMRARNALANKRMRERKKAEKEEPTPRVDLKARARSALDQLTDKQQLALVQERAKTLGFAVAASPAEIGLAPTLGVKELKEAFGKLNPSARMAFVKWACSEVGGVFGEAAVFSRRDEIREAVGA